MPIYPPEPDPFNCVMCGRDCPKKWHDPARREYPPLCWNCEQYGWRQGPLTQNPDQRLIKQIGALSEAITGAAWGKIDGRA